jgi:hypothetical protein
MSGAFVSLPALPDSSVRLFVIKMRFIFGSRLVMRKKLVTVCADQLLVQM